MRRISQTFAPYVFLPSRGVVRLVVRASSTDAATAEVEDVLLHPEHGADMAFCALDGDEQKRADEVASDALETICSRSGHDGLLHWEVSDRVEQDSRALAEAAEGRWRYEPRECAYHDEGCLPSWHHA